MKLICDNQVSLHIASNLVFHEESGTLEIISHFISKKVLAGKTVNDFINSTDHFSDMFTKYLKGSHNE